MLNKVTKTREAIEKNILGKCFFKQNIIRVGKAALIVFVLLITFCLLAMIYFFDKRSEAHKNSSEEILPYYAHNYFDHRVSVENDTQISQAKDLVTDIKSELYPGSEDFIDNDDLENQELENKPFLFTDAEPEVRDVEQKARLSPLSKLSQSKRDDAPLSMTLSPEVALGSDENYLSREHSLIHPKLTETIIAEPRSSRVELSAGTLIPAILISGINSDLPGYALAQVRQPVYDSVTGTKILIPQGAKILLNYDHKISYGQKRILVTAARLIFPDGQSFNLVNMPVTDISGMSGFHDQIDAHYSQIFGSAMALGVISAGLQLGQPAHTESQPSSAGQVMIGGISQNFGDVASQTISQNLAVQPTLSIRPGYLFNILLIQNVVLKNK